jgi:hypothetical protein
VTLETREESKENDVVNSVNGSVSVAVSVSDDNGNKLPFVEIKLLDLTLAITRTTRTDKIGLVCTSSRRLNPATILPIVEMSPDGFLSSLSDYI